MAAGFEEAPGGRVALVAGGSRGVGRATVDRLADRGCAVVVNYVHDQRAAEDAVEAVLTRRGAAVAIRADVTDHIDVQRLYSETVATFGGIDLVAHAVPSGVVGAPMAEVELEVFDELCRTTTRAAVFLSCEAARRVRPGGAIVNLIGSDAGSSRPTSGLGATTFAAIDTLTRALAFELLERDISVNAVSLEVGRPCAPGRVADVIAYLLSDEGHAISGQVIHIDNRKR